MTFVEAQPLGTLLRRPPSYGINAAAVPLTPGIPTYLRITDIDESGRFAPDPKVGVAHPKSPAYQMRVGDLVFARTGASVGKSYLYDARDGELVYAGFLINVAPDPRLLNPRYLSLFAQTKGYWDWIARTSARSGQPGVNGQEYSQLPVPVPDIAIQDSIADVMTDVDDQVIVLERMIAKKNAIKQGIMQRVLSGTTRLPGFGSAWERSTVGAVADVKTGPFGSALHESDYVSTGTPIITVEHLGDRGVIARDVPLVSDSDRVRLAAYGLREGDVVFSRVGAIDRNALISSRESGWLFSGRLLRVRFGERADPAFMSAQFHSQPFRDAVRSVAVGQTMASLNTTILRGIGIWLPPLAEQVAVGRLFRDLDEDLEALDARLRKTKDIRHGMLQDLLTGRRRLPVARSAR
jgi:type I restriction enzyme S subunit